MIVYVKDGIVNIQFDFEYAKLISTTAHNVKFLENETVYLYMFDSGNVSFLGRDNIVTVYVRDAVRDGNKLMLCSAHSVWTFEIESKE